MLGEEEKNSFKHAVKILSLTFNDAEIRIYSIVITYYLLLAFFPLLIAVGNILPFLNISQEHVLLYIQELLPSAIYHFMEETIDNLLTTSNGGLLSISAIGTIWAVSKGINGIQISLNKAYGLSKSKMQLLHRLFSFLMVFLLLFVITLLLIIMGFGQVILEYLLPRLGLPESILTTFIRLRWPVTSTVLFVILLMLFYFVPAVKVHIKAIIPGAIFTTISWMAVTQFFGIYLKFFVKRINSYGFIGGFIIFILWLNIASKLIITGGVLNVTVEKLKYGKIKEKRTVVDYYIEDRLNKDDVKHPRVNGVLSRFENKENKEKKDKHD
ncbi:YihY/virulence factor BrkB family protein [Vagococcus vulneris]|uniref:Uncharacterized protein n=1 Tax=Vagococcus vulneris TaxID=1977869 RepID=A0A429ZZU6_9ENTE|nr:YihY/virulence factor BrkB family protein [Vagococcus vulneris]RST99554.1 hypothetical protein CBF37_04300 [Vagococcus vulneris]